MPKNTDKILDWVMEMLTSLCTHVAWLKGT